MEGTGAPEALGRALRLLEATFGAAGIDRLWIFPPLVRGRRERGLIAVSRFAEGPERRHLDIVGYAAERTGRGLVFEPLLREEGTAPAERIPRVIDGVVRRSGLDSDDPREVRIDGDPARLQALLAELEIKEEVTPT